MKTVKTQRDLDLARIKRGPSEAQIQELCSDWLTLDGWRRIRTDMKQLRGMGVQEPGMADDLFVRYGTTWEIEGHGVKVAGAALWRARRDESMWIEWKMKGGKAGERQIAWHRAERVRGALTLIAGEDFPASIEGFTEWYRKSGLMRRNLRIA